jgi:hypothetical protein
MPSNPSTSSLTTASQTEPWLDQSATAVKGAAAAGPPSGWLAFRPDEDPVSDGGFRGTGGPTGRWRARMVGAAAALLAVGAICGGLVTSALRGTSASATATGFGGQGGPGGTGAEGIGGFGGAGTATAAGVTGALTAVTSSSITLKSTGTAAAATTYLVTSTTRILSGTATVALSTLTVGEQVTVVAAAASATGTSTSATASTITVAAASGAGATGTGTAGTGTTGAPPAGFQGQPGSGGRPGA